MHSATAIPCVCVTCTGHAGVGVGLGKVEEVSSLLGGALVLETKLGVGDAVSLKNARIHYAKRTNL